MKKFEVYEVMIRGRLVAIGKSRVSAMQNARKYGWKINTIIDPRGGDDACRDLGETTLSKAKEPISESQYNTIMSCFSEGDADRCSLSRNEGNNSGCDLLVRLVSSTYLYAYI